MAFEGLPKKITGMYSDTAHYKSQNKTIYYGEVVSVDDPTDGGQIKVKILGLDNQITEVSELPYCFPLVPKFFHVFPKVGEVVRVFIADMNYPQRGRFWIGSIISQPHKVHFDTIYTALSTTNVGLTQPEAAPSTFPDADGVYPTIEDVAIVGRENTDIILRESQTEIRVGKHEHQNPLKLNVKNPASISLTFETKPEEDERYSSTVVMSDKIALITHEGNPKFKAARVDTDERQKIFEQGHPIARGDVLVEALNVFRNAIINHIHGYSGVNADKTTIINDLENLKLDAILQNNVVTN